MATYAQQTNKNTTGRPTQIYVQREATDTKFTLWPVPDSTAAYTVAYYRLVGIDGMSSGISGSAAIPPRFIPALVAGLAYYIAQKKPEAMSMAPALKQEYEFQFQLAANEDTETASIKFVPFNTFVTGAKCLLQRVNTHLAFATKQGLDTLCMSYKSFRRAPTGFRRARCS